MKKEYIKIGGKDFAPILVGFGECCLNCDVKQSRCHWQCHYFEENEEENVALKEVKHTTPTSFWERLKEFFIPLESDTEF